MATLVLTGSDLPDVSWLPLGWILGLQACSTGEHILTFTSPPPESITFSQKEGWRCACSLKLDGKGQHQLSKLVQQSSVQYIRFISATPNPHQVHHHVHVRQLPLCNFRFGRWIRFHATESRQGDSVVDGKHFNKGNDDSMPVAATAGIAVLHFAGWKAF